MPLEKNPDGGPRLQRICRVLKEFAQSKRDSLHRLGMDPDDFVQEAFCTLWERGAIEGLDEDCDNFISMAAKRIFLDLYRYGNRDKRRETPLSIDALSESGVELPTLGDLDPLVFELLLSLPDSVLLRGVGESWRGFFRSWIENPSVVNLAGVYGVSESTVLRAKRELVSFLRELSYG